MPATIRRRSADFPALCERRDAWFRTRRSLGGLDVVNSACSESRPPSGPPGSGRRLSTESTGAGEDRGWSTKVERNHGGPQVPRNPGREAAGHVRLTRTQGGHGSLPRRGEDARPSAHPTRTALAHEPISAGAPVERPRSLRPCPGTYLISSRLPGVPHGGGSLPSQRVTAASAAALSPSVPFPCLDPWVASPCSCR